MMGPTQASPPPEPYSTAMGPEQGAGLAGGLTPELIEQMVSLGTLSQQDAEALRQKMRFEEMQGQANPGGIHTQAGFTSDSPLQGLAGIMREVKGRRGASGAQTEREGIMAQQQKARSAAGQAIGRAMQTPAPAPQTPSDFGLPGSPTQAPMGRPMPPQGAQTRPPGTVGPPQPPKPPMQGDPYGGPGGIPNSPDGWMAMLNMMRGGGIK